MGRVQLERTGAIRPQTLEGITTPPSVAGTSGVVGIVELDDGALVQVREHSTHDGRC